MLEGRDIISPNFARLYHFLRLIMASEHVLDNKMDTEQVEGYDEKATAGGAPTLLTRGVDPDVIAIIAQMSPGRRADVEKKIKQKIDIYLFPMLLIFYILNYLVRLPRNLLIILCDRATDQSLYHRIVVLSPLFDL